MVEICQPRSRLGKKTHNKDATPRYPRLLDTVRSILIAVNELPNDYEDIPALVPDSEDNNNADNEEKRSSDCAITGRTHTCHT
jgi:hypothetical protein